MAEIKPDDKVIFAGWSKEYRSAAEISELEVFFFEEGVVLAWEEGQALIEWNDGTRSFHFNEELKLKPKPIPVEIQKDLETDWNSSAVKVQWLKDQGYKFFKDEKGTSFFIDNRGLKQSVEDVWDRYNTYVISQQVFPRLAVLAAFDGDYARDENGVGFNKLDTVPGHSLVTWYKEKGFWTVGQLLFAIKIQHKYKKQLKRFLGERYKPITTWRGVKTWNKETSQFEAFPLDMLDKEEDGTSDTEN